MEYAFYSLVLGVVFFTGCATPNMSQHAALTQTTQQASVTDNDTSLELREVIQEAETYYDSGCNYYREQQWELALQEFDKAIRILLDADSDAETHYRLGKTYNKIFYQLHKLEVEKKLRRSTDQNPSGAQAGIMPEPLLPDSSDSLVSERENNLTNDDGVSGAENMLGAIEIDPNDPEVMKYVKEFSRQHAQYRYGLERAALYLPMIKCIFQRYHIPIELAYIPVIESNFRLEAVSPTGAVGMWQFIRTTGKNYGLKVDKWVDERRDPVKSTQAAAKYFQELYEMLGDWDLALAGYYMGEYKVHEAIGRNRTRDIATLAASRSFGYGAKQYISRFKAAVLIAKNPERYGMPENLETPLQYETIQVQGGQRLQDIARQYDIPYEVLQEFNAELTKATTPSTGGMYALKVPVGMGTMVVAQTSPESSVAPVVQVASSEDIAEKPRRESASTESKKSVTYRIRRGDTLNKIAARYGIKVDTLKAYNNLSNTRKLAIGRKIKIPMSETIKLARQNVETITHTIQAGETIQTLAKQYHTDIDTIKAYNRIKNVKGLQIGQTLQIPLALSTSVVAQNQKTVSSKEMTTYQVKRGDSLSKIASTFGVSVDQLQTLNQFDKETVLHPGTQIKVREDRE